MPNGSVNLFGSMGVNNFNADPDAHTWHWRQVRDVINESTLSSHESTSASVEATVSSDEEELSSAESVLSSAESLSSIAESVLSSAESVVSSAESVLSSAESVLSSAESVVSSDEAVSSSDEEELSSNKPATVNYCIDRNMPKKHRNRVDRAIKHIEEAAPGIQFKKSKTATNRIHIKYHKTKCDSYVGMQGGKQTLRLAKWARTGNVIHELMHALGVTHEHQRKDRDQYVTCCCKDDINYRIEGMSLGRYDADSIMHYPEVDGVLDCHSVWAPYQRKRLSNGDKIGLNRLYPPVKWPGVYNPKKGTTGLYFCGRHNMENNNAPFGTIGVDGYCGPNTGPNCPSCRQYGGIQERRNDKGRQAKQGETGLFYCRTRFRVKTEQRSSHSGVHDGICGPNNGPNCNSCRRLLE